MSVSVLDRRRRHLSARYAELTRDRTLVSIRLGRDGRLDGCFVRESGELGLLRVEDDWELDGWALVDLSAVSRVREDKRGFQDFAKRIGLRRRCSTAPCEPAAGWRSCLETLSSHGGLIEAHKRAARTYEVGRIERVGRDSFWLRGVDERGVWEPKLKRLRFDALAWVAWDSRYVRVYGRILELHGGLPVRRPTSRVLDVCGSRPIREALCEVVGRDQQVELVLRGRSERELSGCVIEVGRDYVLLANCGRVAFDGWIIVRRAEIVRARRTKQDAEDDFVRERSGLRAERPSLRFDSFLSALRALQHRQQLCALRVTPEADLGGGPFLYFGRIRNLAGSWIEYEQKHFEGSLTNAEWPLRTSRVSAIEFGGRYLAAYESNLMAPTKSHIGFMLEST